MTKKTNWLWNILTPNWTPTYDCPPWQTQEVHNKVIQDWIDSLPEEKRAYPQSQFECYKASQTQEEKK